LKGVVQDAPVTQVQETLERVYREHGGKLWRALFAYTADREVASDAVAESFAQALARGDAIREPASWIWTAAFRSAAGQLKELARQGGAMTVERPIEMPEPIADVVSALARLSPKQRLAIVLHDYADRPTDEVARALGASRATVHVHLSVGRRRLRELLRDDG
jgi:RNA polymerase sigma-70 factor (ECF subfamily)